MLSFRRLYNNGGSTATGLVSGGLLRKPPPVITAPWSRAKSHNAVSGSSNTLSRATSNGAAMSPPKQPNGMGLLNGASSSYHHSSFFKRKWMERTAIATVLLIAWAWIMVFMGMILYHGYQYRQKSGVHSSIKNGIQAVASPPLLETSRAVQAFAQETNKHQESRRIEREQAQQIPPQPDQVANVAITPQESPLLIFTCQRANYLRETLSDILKYIPPDCSMGCPVVVSQDGTDDAVTAVIVEFQALFATQKEAVPLLHIHHKSAIRRGANSVNSYQALAIHYGWALRQVMTGATSTSGAASQLPLPQRVIILEEDLHISVDFFDYFAAMAPILDADTTLMAVSSFNDNGFHSAVQDRSRVLRTDFFPGLGWMMTRQLWTTEFQVKWPNGYWDDWMRLPEQRQGRHILHPEVSRTFHFGVSGGASSNQFGDLLGQVWLNKEAADWHHWSSYLQSKETYDQYYWGLVEPATLVTDMDTAVETTKEHDARIEYSSHAEFQRLVRQLNPPLMDDEKVGIHRTEYHGIVETRPHGHHFLFLTPPMEQLRTNFADTIAALPQKAEKVQ